MCGIAGIFHFEGETSPTLEQVSTMISPLAHRGPDEAGVYLDGRIALGNVRLSIIGIDGGTQPISNENGTLWIVYNGETFNYIELKEELLKKGHRFTTETDTEVLLHLYEEYGTECLQKINGQFSFAIWDSRKRELFLARDRVGIRPLYYTFSDGRLYFASEIKAILAAGGARELDGEALSQVFIFWSTLPGRTVFKGVRELPPGHCMLVKNGSATPEAYWRIPHYAHNDMQSLSLDDAIEELRALLTDAVKIRLRADVPVGAYLSGGLDSSIIAMLVSRNFNTSLTTFSMGFQEDPFDETPFQDELIRFIGVDHRRVLIDNEQILGCLQKTIWHCETPILRTAPVPLFILSSLVNTEGFKVVLCGEGADELFGGYNIFKEAKIRSFWGKQPESAWRPLLLQRLYPYIFSNPSRFRHYLQSFFAVKAEQSKDPFFSHMLRWKSSEKNLTIFSDDYIAALGAYDPFEELASRLPHSFFDRDLLSRAQVLEMELFLSNYLLSSQGDRVAMAHSVEARHPFLDVRLIDFSLRLPGKWKLRGLNEKYILKRAFQGQIPERITRRAKQPYRAPIRELFSPHAAQSNEYVDSLLSTAYLKKSGYFNVNRVSSLFARYRGASEGLTTEFQNMALIGVLSTQILHQQFVEGASLLKAGLLRPDRIIDATGGYPTYCEQQGAEPGKVN
ncbi:asparagine synthase (glutamine-hydrolyzing) [Pelobacter propionicus]|uniref:asparagine synthase (glutamine-hydrolyzing) n=1 Tax=Pelobacter propionicus (strain DSM 2379 / NBRC 103807 / OttBd1) TaxID=338966 RepID=A1ASZ8_PELPD|nr:asparagine synthase (glutamine-hydrolyzing) [Pelobacter propionicus]ABL00469.1 asparagine synthase (glutamine-hydrolyzing) [Pelobacter propionicus DSM 2379]